MKPAFCYLTEINVRAKLFSDGDIAHIYEKTVQTVYDSGYKQRAEKH